MIRITDHWLEHYLQMMRTVYYNMTDDREFTNRQKDKIKKTLTAFNDNFKKITKDGKE